MEQSKKCLVCGKIFYKYSNCSVKRWSERKFCSRKCASLSFADKPHWNTGIKYTKEMKAKLNMKGLEKGWGWLKNKKRPELSGEKHPNWKPKIEKRCEVCHNKMILSQWEVKHRFCSRACWAIGHRGDKSPVWKGENSYKSLRRYIHDLPEHKKWHAECLRRDWWKCIKCGSKKDIEVHHIISLAEIVYRYKVSTENARDILQLWEIDNGETLCRECHRKTDTYLSKNIIKSIRSKEVE